MKIASRASWGALYANGVGNRPVGSLQKYLHHTVTRHLPANATVAQERAEMRTVERIGQQRFGRGISYTICIFPSGRAYWGASIHRISYHSGGGRDGKPRNTLGVGIVLVGNTHANPVTPQQQDALVAVLQHGVRQKWWNDPAISEGHRDFKATSCPGDYAYRLIPTINRRARGGTYAEGKNERDDLEIQLALAVLGHYDAGDSLQWLDGVNGASQKRATEAYQRSRGLHPDGWWGTSTDQHYERNDMSKVEDRIARAVWGFVHSSEKRNMGYISRLTNRDVVTALGNQAGLLKAIEQLAGGQSVDLDAVKAAAEKGVSAALGNLEADVTLTIGGPESSDE